MELVSVVVPSYNAESFIRESVQSALQQTHPLVEVIVVDDCSSDATASIVAQAAAADARVRLLRNAVNAGPAAARNRGIMEAQGTWVALLDADDAFEPTRIEQLLRMTRQHELDIVSDNLLLLPADGSPPRIMLPRCQIAAPRLMSAAEFINGNVNEQRDPRVSYGFMKPIVRRSFLDAHRLRYREQNRFGEDYIFAIECLLKGAQWLVTPDPLYRYRVRPGSLSETARSTDLHEIRTLEERLLREDPTVAANPFLAHALRRHKATIDRWYYYLLFTQAVKAKSLGTAVRLLLGRPERFWHIVMESLRQAPVITAKALRGGYWQDITMAAAKRSS
jgi:glycosyltransferase involved in cell wall biosynthesis